MCYEDGKLMEYLDGETSPDTQAEIEAHLDACEICAATAGRLREDRAFAATALERVRVGEFAAEGVLEAPVMPVCALSAPVTERRRGWRAYLAEFGWAKAASIAVATFTLASLGLAPVRSFASDLLSIFRVEHIRTIDLSASELTSIGMRLGGYDGEGHVDLGELGEAWVEGDSHSHQMTLEEAQAAVDFPLLAPDAGIAGTPTVTLQGALTLKFKLNVDEFNDLLTFYGSEKGFPRSLDGKVFEIQIPAAVIMDYGVYAESHIAEHASIGQARSPELIVPEGVDPLELRDALLSVPFLPENVRRQLESIDDWHRTLIVPNVDGSAREISVAGVPAVLMYPEETLDAIDAAKQDPDSPSSAAGVSEDVEPQVSVIWQQGGVLRAVFAYGDERTIAIAESMIR